MMKFWLSRDEDFGYLHPFYMSASKPRFWKEDGVWRLRDYLKCGEMIPIKMKDVPIELRKIPGGPKAIWRVQFSGPLEVVK